MSVSKTIQQGYDELAEIQKRQGLEQAALAEAQALQQVKDLAAAQTARNQALNDAQRVYQMAQDQNYKSTADILSSYKQQEDEARAEMEQKVKKDKEAAAATGYAQLGSALANLFYVGNQNAVSQQHQNFSQDWMKKADADMREHRGRIDDLRERQRAIQMQLDQLKMGDAATALANAQKRAEQDMQDRLARSQAEANAKLTPAQMRSQAELGAAQTRLQGTQQAASIVMNEASLAERRRQFDAEMAAKGFNADGSPNEKYLQRLADASFKTSKSSGGSSSGNYYDFVVDGKHYRTNMSTETYKSGIPRGKEELKKDVLRNAGFNGTWEEFTEQAAGRGGKRGERKASQGQYKDYMQIVRAINGQYGLEDENNDYIRSYVEENKNKLDHFNAYMISLAGNVENYIPYGEPAGVSQPQPAAPSAPSTPAATGAPADTTSTPGYLSQEEYLKKLGLSL